MGNLPFSHVKMIDQWKQARRAERWNRVGAAVADAVATYYCPSLRQKPVILLTTDDIRLLQVCEAAGR